MNKKTFSPQVAIAAAAILLTAAAGMSAFAQNKRSPTYNPITNPSAAAAAKAEQKANTQAKVASTSANRAAKAGEHTAAQMKRMIERANKEIDNRITGLNKLSARIQGMKKVTDASKTNLKSTIDGEIATLIALKTKIAADTDTETMRTDIESITKAYRIYALIMPQIAIIAAADRANTVADAMTALSKKLSGRIAAAGSTGNNVTALYTQLADMSAKITDAQTQAQAAVGQVSVLKADNGDQAIFDANKAALKAAHEKIKTAKKDIEDARKDAKDIAKGLRTFAKPSRSPSPSASTSASPSPTPSNS